MSRTCFLQFLHPLRSPVEHPRTRLFQARSGRFCASDGAGYERRVAAMTTLPSQKRRAAFLRVQPGQH